MELHNPYLKNSFVRSFSVIYLLALGMINGIAQFLNIVQTFWLELGMA